MAVELPLPPHWNPARVEEVWRVEYEEREGQKGPEAINVQQTA